MHEKYINLSEREVSLALTRRLEAANRERARCERALFQSKGMNTESRSYAEFVINQLRIEAAILEAFVGGSRKSVEQLAKSVAQMMNLNRSHEIAVETAASLVEHYLEPDRLKLTASLDEQNIEKVETEWNLNGVGRYQIAA